jgi:hypothetical protein
VRFGEDFDAALHRALKKALIEAIGIDLRAIAREQSGGTREAEAAFDVGFAEIFQFDAGFAAGFKFFLQLPGFRGFAGQIEAGAALESASVANVGQESFEFVEGADAELIAAKCIFLPHEFDQLAKRCVQLILKQPRAGHGAAAAGLAAIKQHRRDPRFGQMISDQRAGDSAAENGDLAGFVAVELRIWSEFIPLKQPEWTARAKVHVGS